jgi:hypothetical protein
MYRYQTWREALQLAGNVDAIRGLVDEFMVAIRPVAGVLPESCRLVLQPGVDVQEAAVTLLQGEMGFAGSEEERSLLHEIAHTLAAAAVRMTMLHPRPSRDSAAAPAPPRSPSSRE